MEMDLNVLRDALEDMADNLPHLHPLEALENINVEIGFLDFEESKMLADLIKIAWYASDYSRMLEKAANHVNLLVE